jgi:hypothetical protein
MSTADTGGGGGPGNRRSVNLALALGVFLALCALSECGTRLVIYAVFGSSTQGMHEVFRYEPYLIHSDDERLHVAYPDKGDRVRVVVIGGSTAEQMPSEFMEAAMTRALKRPVEVINLAQGGYITTQEVIVLGLYGLRLKPDLVVTIDGVNDIISMTKTGIVGIPYHNGVVAAGVDHPFLNALLAIGRHSQFINLLNKLFERRREVQYQSDEGLTEATVDAYMRNLDAMSAMCRGIGAPHVRVLQPYMPLRENRTEDEMTIARRFAYRFDYVKRVFEEMDVRLKEVPPGVAYASALHCLDTVEGTRFVDEVHLVTQGYEELADCIGRGVEASVETCSPLTGPRICLKPVAE